VVILLLAGLRPSASRAADSHPDALAQYRVTVTTETVNHNKDGTVKSRDVVRESRVDIREKVTETFAADEFGNLRVVYRQTATLSTRGDSETYVEELRGEPPQLVVISRTSVTKDAEGHPTTVEEVRDADGNMRMIKRTVVKRVRDQIVTLVEAPDQYGNLYQTQTVTKR